MVYIHKSKSSIAFYHVKNIIDNWCSRNPGKRPFVHIRVMEFKEDNRRLVKFDPSWKVENKELKLNMVHKVKMKEEHKVREYRHTLVENDSENSREVKSIKQIKTTYENIKIETKNTFSVLEIEGNDCEMDFAIEESNVEEDLYDILTTTNSETVNHKVARRLKRSIFYKPFNEIISENEELVKEMDEAKVFMITKPEIEVKDELLLKVKNTGPNISENESPEEYKTLREFKTFIGEIVMNYDGLMKHSRYHSGSEQGLGKIVRKFHELFSGS